MIDHVLPQRHDNQTNLPDEEVRPPYKCLLDEYDDDGNYIGNNPKYMDIMILSQKRNIIAIKYSTN